MLRETMAIVPEEAQIALTEPRVESKNPAGELAWNLLVDFNVTDGRVFKRGGTNTYVPYRYARTPGVLINSQRYFLSQLSGMEQEAPRVEIPNRTVYLVTIVNKNEVPVIRFTPQGAEKLDSHLDIVPEIGTISKLLEERAQDKRPFQGIKKHEYYQMNGRNQRDEVQDFLEKLPAPTSRLEGAQDYGLD